MTNMWRSKKVVVSAVLVAVLLFGSLGGIALANGDDEDSPPGAPFGLQLERVCEIYEEEMGVAIEPEALADAFAQARDEAQEDMMQSHLQDLVEQGEVTQEQADQFYQWQQSRPDMPFRFGFRGHGGPRGFGGPGPCAPSQDE